MNSAHSTTTDGAHQGPPHAHHWDPVTAYSGAKLGMWLFLATEILLFAVMFCGFALYRYHYLEEFHQGSHHLDWKLGALNTVVLLLSSYTAALAVDAGQHGNNKGVVKYFGISILCGLIFMVVKAFEYHHKFESGLMPPGLFPGEHSANFEHYKNFLGFYFCMTGLHGLHVLIGMGLMIWVSGKAARNRFSTDYYTPVELTALYWHLVDLIWIYLFPLLYLVG